MDKILKLAGYLLFQSLSGFYTLNFTAVKTVRLEPFQKLNFNVSRLIYFDFPFSFSGRKSPETIISRNVQLQHRCMTTNNSHGH
jgi:hypothetical protein